MTVKLIVGLGNPGAEYASTRHNAGFAYVDELARQHGARFSPDKKYYGETCKITLAGQPVWLLKPMTYMNRSGQGTAALANFYKIPPEEILVAHDELDLPPGAVRFKAGGGHGGHNGLRDIVAKLGNNKNFKRLRIGIGHPGHASQVSAYVLSKASPEDQQKIASCIDEACRYSDLPVSGEWDRAMNMLNGFKA